MTQANQNNPGGIDPLAGGEGQDGESQIQDKVDYRTYRKAVDNEKKLKQALAERETRLAEFEKQQQAANEAKLLEQNQHLTVIEQLKKQNEELNGKIQSFHEAQTFSRKMHAAVGLLHQKGIQLDQKYLDLIPADAIQVDAEGKPDMASVVKAVDSFIKEHPRLVAALPNDLPGTRPGNSSTTLTYEAWTKLPPKEKKERFKDIKQ
jgi:hypothetical protein